MKAAKARGASNADTEAALASAREQQAATREVLEAMSASSFDLKKVLQTIAESAVRLCKADNASVILRDAVTAFETLGSAGEFEIGFDDYERYYAGRTFQPGKGSLTGRVLLARKTIQIEDMSTDPDYDPSSAPTMIPQTLLGVPIMRDDDVAGLIIVRRYHVALFSAREIEILETFSQQAAIAIENVRLFNGTKEALERQTALSEILTAMSASPTEIEPVFEAIARSAARYCGAEDAFIALAYGSKVRIEAHHGPVAVYDEHPEWQLDRTTVTGRSIVDGAVVQVEDLPESEDFPLGRVQARDLGYRTVLAAPLLREGRPIGTICLRRLQVRPFEPRQVELLRAFAAQAAIAIENVRLFNETKQALEQQTAVADVLQSMSRSAFDLQAVFDVVVENATKLCRGDWGYLFRKQGELFQLIASHGGTRALTEYERSHPTSVSDRTLIGRVALRRAVVHIPDLFEDPEYDWPTNLEYGVHTVLGVPIIRDGEVIGAIGVARNERRPFSDADIRLVQTFADQATIAMENVRLFNETKESLGQQTALSDVLKTISRSAFDLDAVLQTIVERAAALGGADGASIFRREGDDAIVLARFGDLPPAFVVRGTRIPVDEGTIVGRAFLTGQRQYIEDATQHPELPQDGPRTRLAIPFLRDGKAIGVMSVAHNLHRPFGDREMQMLETFADQAAIAIENVRLFNETKESLERQTALAEILRVIASSPSDQQPVFDAIATNATRYCGAEDAVVFLKRGDEIARVAHHGPIPLATNPSRDLERTSVVGRAILDGHTVHIADITGPAGDEFPSGRIRSAESGDRGILGTPLLREGTAIGAILLRKMDTSGFTPSQIQLVEAFADQAVIAIENVRLFNETKESLERQTALAEILSVIADSPADQQPVVDAIARNTTRYCGAEDAAVLLVDGDALLRVAHHGPVAYVANPRIPLERGAVAGRAVLERRTVHVPDIAGPEGESFPETRARAMAVGQRGALAAPLLREGVPIGVILLRKTDPTGFQPSQILLLEAFADQAVIAIENVRLFNETREALDRQSATADVLKVMSASPFDLEPVLQSLVDTAARLCDADNCVIFRRESDHMRMAASSLGSNAAVVQVFREHLLEVDRTTLTGRAVLNAMTVHVPDASTDQELVMLQERREYLDREGGAIPEELRRRTGLSVPLIREGDVIGAFTLWRHTIRPFTPREIELIETFARQAVIAIENVRLFNETKEALERQTAISAILRAITDSPDNERPVLATIAHSATVFCGAADAAILLIRDGRFRFAAHHGPVLLSSDSFTISMTKESVAGHAVVDRRTIQVADVLGPEGDAYPQAREGFPETGQRAVLATPLVREGAAIGAIVLRKIEPGAFSPSQVSLIEAFADQAVIAIENVRLFNETKEALEQQTATSEVLKSISRAPFELQPILDTLVQNAARLTGADNADLVSFVGGKLQGEALFGQTSEEYRRVLREAMDGRAYTPSRGTLVGRTLLERKPVHIVDVLEDAEYEWHESQRAGGFRTLLGVPLMRQDRPIGVIIVWRREVKPFADKQIELLTTFADQAVIAMENVRLFNETKEALEQQTAVGEVLKTISRSAFDLQPVLDIVLDNAVRLAGADIGWLSRVENERFMTVAYSSHFPQRVRDELVRQRAAGHVAGPWVPLGEQGGVMGFTLAEGRTVHVVDVRADEQLKFSAVARLSESRTVIGVPMLREGQTIGGMVLARYQVRQFSEREIELVQTFADQAAIAIGNVRLFNEIQDKSQQLEIASRHKSEFLANMSHELRTPLNAIIGFSEVLLQGIFGDVNEKQREYLADVLGSGKHLLSLINDILDLSKIEAGRMDLEVSTFSLRDALDSGLTIVRERAARHGIQLSATVAEGVGAIEADERKVKQILYNLLSNAVKFTSDGGRVEVSVRAEGGDVRVEVRDTGIGIAGEDQQRIFEEFRQVGRERSREGTGLGLTLTKRFVELHGGRIWLESSPGKGSTFAFTLPARRPAAVRA